VLLEEWMLLDLLRAIYTEALDWISVEKARKDATRLGPNVRPKDEWVREDFLVHLVCHLWYNCITRTAKVTQ